MADARPNTVFTSGSEFAFLIPVRVTTQMTLQKRPAVPVMVKRELLLEAGGKCANPGCTSSRIQFHHIQEWHIHRTHDRAHMIAICPTCHDAVHNGSLTIDDDVIYAWKRIKRPSTSVRAHLYVEPAVTPTVLFGNFPYIASTSNVVLFRLSDYCRFGIRVNSLDVILTELRIAAPNGEVAIEGTDGHILINDPNARLEQRPGHIRVTCSAPSQIVPQWVIDQVRQTPAPPRDGKTSRQNMAEIVGSINGFARSGTVTLLDLNVLEPGVVRVGGAWVDRGLAIVGFNLISIFMYQGGGGAVMQGGGLKGPRITIVGPILEGVWGMNPHDPPLQ
jgi:hypothetical protein